MLVMQHILSNLPPAPDPYQFAYRANRSTYDAIWAWTPLCVTGCRTATMRDHNEFRSGTIHLAPTHRAWSPPGTGAQSPAVHHADPGLHTKSQHWHHLWVSSGWHMGSRFQERRRRWVKPTAPLCGLEALPPTIAKPYSAGKVTGASVPLLLVMYETHLAHKAVSVIGDSTYSFMIHLFSHVICPWFIYDSSIIMWFVHDSFTIHFFSRFLHMIHFWFIYFHVICTPDFFYNWLILIWFVHNSSDSFLFTCFAHDPFTFTCFVHTIHLWFIYFYMWFVRSILLWSVHF